MGSQADRQENPGKATVKRLVCQAPGHCLHIPPCTFHQKLFMGTPRKHSTVLPPAQFGDFPTFLTMVTYSGHIFIQRRIKILIGIQLIFLHLQIKVILGIQCFFLFMRSFLSSADDTYPWQIPNTNWKKNFNMLSLLLLLPSFSRCRALTPLSNGHKIEQLLLFTRTAEIPVTWLSSLKTRYTVTLLLKNW